ncbi:MAG: hypothetical protein R6U89_07580 [Dehalococcoidia bacterium]
MRIVSFYFPHFPIQVELRADASISGRPVVIGGLPHERKPVFDASEEAMACGIRPGIALRQACGLCPDALFLSMEEGKYERESERIADLISGFTTELEEVGLGEVLIEVPFDSWESGLVSAIRMAIGEQEGFTVTVASASNKFVAQAGGRTGKRGGVTRIPVGKERAFMSGLPVNMLPASEEVLRRLELLGISRMGELAALPREGVGRAFGVRGERLRELARGVDRSPLIPRRKPPSLAEQVEFDPPVEAMDRLMAGVGEMAERLARRLGWRWQCCRRMSGRFSTPEGESVEIVVEFKQPIASAEEMLRHLKNRLENTRFSGPVGKGELVLNNLCGEQGGQLKLLYGLPRQRQSLLEAIRMLQERYGSSAIKRVVLSESNSRLPEEAFSLVDYA